MPAEAEIPPYFILRAGMIRKLVSGVYSFMPLGKGIAEDREHRSGGDGRKGAQEILMSAIQPAELWRESGRWYAYGPEMAP